MIQLAKNNVEKRQQSTKRECKQKIKYNKTIKTFLTLMLLEKSMSPNVFLVVFF